MLKLKGTNYFNPHENALKHAHSNMPI